MPTKAVKSRCVYKKNEYEVWRNNIGKYDLYWKEADDDYHWFAEVDKPMEAKRIIDEAIENNGTYTVTINK